MTGIDDLMAESNERWAKASQRSQGIADKGIGEALGTYYKIYFPLGLLVLIPLGAGGAALMSGMALTNPMNLQFGLLLAAAGALVGGLLYNAKRVRPAVDLGSVDVLMSLDNRERKQVRQQILGKTPSQANRLGVARAAAVQQRKSLATQLLVMPMLPLAFIPQALPGSGSVSWLMALLVFFYLVTAVLLVGEFRRNSRFLAATANQTGGQDA